MFILLINKIKSQCTPGKVVLTYISSPVASALLSQAMKLQYLNLKLPIYHTGNCGASGQS